MSRHLRFEVLRRDGFACRYCGRKAPDVQLTVDHVTPVALGGSDEPANLVCACSECNIGKAATSSDPVIVADVEQDALRWSLAMKRAAEIQQANAGARQAYISAFDDAWLNWTYADGHEVTRPNDWSSTVGHWHDRGLQIGLIVDLVNDCLPRNIPDNRMWRYVCGAVRNVLQERLEIASELLLREDEGASE